MRRRFMDWLGYVRDRGYVQVGPLVFTTWKQYDKNWRNCFEIGMTVGGGQWPDDDRARLRPRRPWERWRHNRIV